MINVAVKAARAAGSLINRAALDIESVRSTVDKRASSTSSLDGHVDHGV